MRSIAYFAGLFDGEGCVTIRRLKRARENRYNYSISCGISISDPRPLYEMRRKFGGGIYKVKVRPDDKPMFRWLVVCRMAQAFLLIMEDELLVKRAEVKIALRFQRHLDAHRYGFRTARGVRNDGGSTSCFPEYITEYREKLYRQLRALKRRRFHPTPVGPS